MAFGKTSGGYQWLLVCLGNPGKQYEGDPAQHRLHGGG